MLKKLTAFIITAATLATCSFAAAPVQASATDPTIKHVGKSTQKNGDLVIYSYNVPSDTGAALNVTDSKNNETTYKMKDFFNHPQVFSLGRDEFKTTTWISVSGGSGGGGSAPSINLKNSGGKYECVKIKLSDFSNYFNTNGSHTQSVSDIGKHKYIFREEAPDANNNIFSSVLYIYSGGAVNHVVPDKDGMVQVYLSTKPGEPVMFTTSFHYVIRQDGRYATGGGGGTSGITLPYLSIGDCDGSGYMNVGDVTTIQKYTAKILDFNKAQLRCGDLNGDGTVNIMDATYLQMELAK